jgi:hypothetical protein
MLFKQPELLWKPPRADLIGCEFMDCQDRQAEAL